MNILLGYGNRHGKDFSSGFNGKPRIYFDRALRRWFCTGAMVTRQGKSAFEALVNWQFAYARKIYQYVDKVGSSE